jgi:copper chaperone CopZ
MVETVYCVHCGAVAKHPVTKTIGGQLLAFCCSGCLQVYEMLAEEGVAAPAALPVATPAGPACFSGPSQTLSLPVLGMSCASCVARVEAGLRSVPGVLSVQVDLEAGRATVEVIPGQATPAGLRQAVQAAGYEAPG